MRVIREAQAEWPGVYSGALPAQTDIARAAWYGLGKRGGHMGDIQSAVWWDEDGLHLIDQTRLPGAYIELRPQRMEEVADAIRRLAVRGAPAIGIAAGFGLYLAVQDGQGGLAAAWKTLEVAALVLKSTRPTAVNLFWAIDRVVTEARAAKPATPEALRVSVLSAATAIWQEDILLCHRIGEHGKPLLKGARAVLTHCNAGALGTAGWGTATAPLYAWLEEGVRIPVYADETRPLLQGARLTAWELSRAGIPVTVVPDGAAASVLARGLVDAVVVGADRIARNGDVANKIGTYAVALAAHAHGVPFYVAAPFSTFDLRIATGREIVVEERSPEEVTRIQGVQIAPEGVKALNLAFDVTPGRYITALITDRGVIRPPYDETVPALMEAVAP
jgi:methylthioribose-1-phosphate isomerase